MIQLCWLAGWLPESLTCDSQRLLPAGPFGSSLWDEAGTNSHEDPTFCIGAQCSKALGNFHQPQPPSNSPRTHNPSDFPRCKVDAINFWRNLSFL